MIEQECSMIVLKMVDLRWMMQIVLLELLDPSKQVVVFLTDPTCQPTAKALSYCQCYSDGRDEFSPSHLPHWMIERGISSID